MSSLHLFAATAQTLRRAYRLADAAVVADIESNTTLVELDGQQWRDVAPMLDEREHAPQAIDMTTEALCYGLARGLLLQHHQQRHLVRIAKVLP